MTVPMRPIPPELLAEGRRLYEQTRLPIRDIAGLLGIGERTFNRRRKEWGWPSRKARVPRYEPPRTAADLLRFDPVPAPSRLDRPVAPTDGAASHPALPACPVSGDPPDPGSLALRIQSAVERELFAIEQIVAKLRPAREHTEEAERAARVLASLARTLQEIAKLDRRPAAAKDDTKDDDRGPDDPDEFLIDLARRMDAFAERRQNPVPDVAAEGDA